MTERINHAAEARLRILDAEDEYTRDGGPIRENVSDWLAFAQVHATLALVEQQRIANLIALATPQSGIGPGGEVSLPSWIPATDGKIAYMRLRPEITDALGMEETK